MNSKSEWNVKHWTFIGAIIVLVIFVLASSFSTNKLRAEKWGRIPEYNPILNGSPKANINYNWRIWGTGNISSEKYFELFPKTDALLMEDVGLEGEFSLKIYTNDPPDLWEKREKFIGKKIIFA